jgi:hypothetical protein
VNGKVPIERNKGTHEWVPGYIRNMLSRNRREFPLHIQLCENLLKQLTGILAFISFSYRFLDPKLYYSFGSRLRRNYLAATAQRVTHTLQHVFILWPGTLVAQRRRRLFSGL